MSFRCRHSFVLMSLSQLTFLAIFSDTRAEDEKTSRTDAQLARWLKQFPQADANKDGILTESEARDYRNKRRNTQRAGQGRGKPVPTHANVKYGDHERQFLDVWLAESENPTPVVVYIHGGGFVAGSKESVHPGVIAQCREAGISVAAINYRFATTDPFPASQHDGARAIQFLRSKAKDWNLDKDRVAAYGGSAGAGISMWLAFHDDLADKDNDDPVLRESSRLTCVGSFGGQSSYDPHVIKEWVGGRAHEHPSVFKVYNVSTLEELDDPKLQPLYDEVSAIKHLTRDDPPIIMFYNEPNGPLPADARPGQGIHHPVFGHKLKEAMGKLGIEAVYYHQSDLQGDPATLLVEFFKKHFGLSQAGKK